MFHYNIILCEPGMGSRGEVVRHFIYFGKLESERKFFLYRCESRDHGPMVIGIDL